MQADAQFEVKLIFSIPSVSDDVRSDRTDTTSVSA